jgi:hypothetical protein
MGTKIGDLDPVESEEVAEEGRTGESEAAVEEAEKDNEFVLTRGWLSFLAWNSPLVLRLFWEDPGRDVGDQRRSFAGGLVP